MVLLCPQHYMEAENTSLEMEKHLQSTNFWVPAVSFACVLSDERVAHLSVGALNQHTLPAVFWLLFQEPDCVKFGITVMLLQMNTPAMEPQEGVYD